MFPSSQPTMKVKIVSDQHLEFLASDGKCRKYFNAIHPATGEMADVCVVAGDFDVIAPRSRAFFQELCHREQQVLYVPGNHDYYGCTSMESVDDTLREFEYGLTNLIVLRTGLAYEFGGTRFSCPVGTPVPCAPLAASGKNIRRASGRCSIA